MSEPNSPVINCDYFARFIPKHIFVPTTYERMFVSFQLKKKVFQLKKRVSFQLKKKVLIQTNSVFNIFCLLQQKSELNNAWEKINISCSDLISSFYSGMGTRAFKSTWKGETMKLLRKIPAFFKGNLNDENLRKKKKKM